MQRLSAENPWRRAHQMDRIVQGIVTAGLQVVGCVGSNYRDPPLMQTSRRVGSEAGLLNLPVDGQTSLVSPKGRHRTYALPSSASKASSYKPSSVSSYSLPRIFVSPIFRRRREWSPPLGWKPKGGDHQPGVLGRAHLCYTSTRNHSRQPATKTYSQHG